MNISPKNILLIDGNKKERFPIAVMLNRFGHQVRLTTHGGEAQDCLKSENYDLMGTSNNSIFYCQATRRPLFHKACSWPRCIFRGALNISRFPEN